MTTVIARIRLSILLLSVAMLTATPLLHAQAATRRITTPKEEFGFNIGDDYKLSTYTQQEAYYKKLAAESDRIKLVEIGMTEEGHHQYLMIITSPANMKNLEHYREISEKMARGRVTEAEARKLADEGKAVVWIDGSIHATETPSTDQLVETAYELASRNDEQTLKILDKDIILLCNVNPDGVEHVSEAYMKEPVPNKRVQMLLPELHKKYIGQEDNRDFFASTFPEEKNEDKVLYTEWYPQILYNHHGASYTGAVIAAGSYRDPFSTRYHPIVMSELDSLTSAMNNGWEAAHEPGALERDSVPYSTWYNGSIRTTGYYHNVVGILTEIMGSPNPTEVTLVPDRLLPSSNMFLPPAPQTWHYKQSIDMLITANWTVMSYAARNHDDVLLNEYRMAKDSIDEGSKDYWTIYPKRVDAIKALYQADLASGNAQAAQARRGGGGHSSGFASGNSLLPIPSKYYNMVMKDPKLRDPRGYIIPSDQTDFPTAVKFINDMIRGGMEVQKATASFTVNGKSYPAGSYVIKTDQAYRPLVLDMFEAQDYPMDIKYPGGPPVPPYDAAGWTLAMEMGIDYDRELDAFTGPFEKLVIGKEITPPPVKVTAASTGGWIVSPKNNDSFLLVNQLLAGGADVYRLPGGAGEGGVYGPGTFYVAPGASAGAAVSKAAAGMGVTATAVSGKPSGNMIKLAPARIAVWEKYGGSQNAGWMRWVMEHYGFKYTMLFPKEIDAGDLHAKYDVIVFAPGAIPTPGFAVDNPQENFMGRMPKDPDIDPKYRSWTGVLTVDKSIEPLKAFAEDGGTIIAMGESSHLADDFGAPVTDMLSPDGKPLSHEQFYIPGSLLTGAVDTSLPVSWGIASSVDFYFDSTGMVGNLGAPVYTLGDSAAAAGIKPIVTFGTAPPLASGWAVGQEHLANGVAAFMMPVGKGTLYAYSMEPTFRNWSHSTFKLLFNELYTYGATQ